MLSLVLVVVIIMHGKENVKLSTNLHGVISRNLRVLINKTTDVKGVYAILHVLLNP